MKVIVCMLSWKTWWIKKATKKAFAEFGKALENLKSFQAQIFQSLKMARVVITFSLILCMNWNVISQSNKKPNIIFILTDDQLWDALGIMGNTIVQTPHMNKLANDGILFHNAYVTTSICCVSRASILTGQYQSRHKINDFKTNLSQQAFAQTYPMLLRKSGYRLVRIYYNRFITVNKHLQSNIEITLPLIYYRKV